MGLVSQKLRDSASLPTDRRFVDLTGKRFGRLTVLSYQGRPKPSFHVWQCGCDCGNETVIEGSRLKSGKAKSCGCLRRELSAARRLRHGRTDTAEHNTWIGMKGRCYNPANPKFYRYGGRGITVCERWRDNFENFAADMGPRPSPLHSIDRIDNDRGYEPGNCRWATQLEQQRNRGGKRRWKGL
jgi:hypothetical protein